ncbi:MAG TPA: hypothetical protein PKE40_07545 [Arachnia sp.]|nr:hypothetical protein [Arachnia sp.]HMT86189.1 hypothetical protein [Arachnia sp.]
MTPLDPVEVEGRLAAVLDGLSDLDGAPLDEQYRRLDEAQRALGEVLAGAPEAPQR